MAATNRSYDVLEKSQLLLDFLILETAISSVFSAKKQAFNLKYSFRRLICCPFDSAARGGRTSCAPHPRAIGHTQAT
jgi:hypothetical protein